MPLDPTLTGRTYPPEPYLVGREKIREFAAAIGDTTGAYVDPEAAKSLGYPDVIAPPTFAMAVTAASSRRVFEDPELGLDFSRVVHGDQRFVYQRPIRAGDRLLATSTIEQIMARAGHDFLTTRTDVTTEDGEAVLSAWSKLVVRGPDHGDEA